MAPVPCLADSRLFRHGIDRQSADTSRAWAPDRSGISALVHGVPPTASSTTARASSPRRRQETITGSSKRSSDIGGAMGHRRDSSASLDERAVPPRCQRQLHRHRSLLAGRSRSGYNLRSWLPPVRHFAQPAKGLPMKRKVTLKLADKTTKHYKADGSDGKWWVYRYEGGVFSSNYRQIGKVTTFNLALELMNSDAGGEVVDTTIEDM